MLKINFLLKKSDTDQGNLEYVTISSPRVAKIENDRWESRYVCDVYLSNIKYEYPTIYNTNPIDTLQLALEIVKVYLQGLINGSYVISDAESCQPWKLEKGKTFSERIREIKNSKDISAEDKEKMFGILKDTFGKTPYMEDWLNEAINKN